MTNPSALAILASGTVLAATCLVLTPVKAGDGAEAARLVAVQVREQGFPCQEPSSAKRDPETDDDAVWILACNDASYHVRLVPDEAAQVQRLY